MNMQDMGTNDQGQGTDQAATAGGDVLSKIEALKSQIANIGTALDDIAASVSGEEKPEDQASAETPAPEAGAEAPVPEVTPGKAPMFGKKKPQNDLVKGLGF
jgi:hypothetical protein